MSAPVAALTADGTARRGDPFPDWLLQNCQYFQTVPNTVLIHHKFQTQLIKTRIQQRDFINSFRTYPASRDRYPLLHHISAEGLALLPPAAPGSTDNKFVCAASPLIRIRKANYSGGVDPTELFRSFQGLKRRVTTARRVASLHIRKTLPAESLRRSSRLAAKRIKKEEITQPTLRRSTSQEVSHCRCKKET